MDRISLSILRTLSTATLPLTLALLANSPAYSATITAKSCSLSDVQSAYSSAAAGDKISIPAGNCSWSGTLSVAKTNLTFQGSGVGQTIIVPSGTAFTLSATSANGVRITGIEFRSCGSQCLYFNRSSTEGTKNLRVDNCKFLNTGDTAMDFQGHISGVVDHCIFADSYGSRVYGANDSSTFPFTLGTSDSIFFEDNTITLASGAPHFIASNSGSRYVIRHNTFTSSVQSFLDLIDAHGYCEVSGRGSFTWEVYENTFNISNGGDRLIHLRGGQGVVFNNTIHGSLSWPIVVTDYMACSPPCVSTWDGQYPVKDQINRSYFWNNGPNVTNDCSKVLQLNRDYYQTAMPGYTPFQYPHPLVTNSPGAPRNLRIVP